MSLHPLLRAKKPLTATTLLLLGAAILGAAACGVDDERKMQTSTGAGRAGMAGNDSGGSSNTPEGGSDDGGDGPTVSGGKAGMGGKAGAGGMSGGKAGMGGNGGSKPSSPCGNGTKESGEECDDGNDKSGDGCSAQCWSECEKCEADWDSIGPTYSIDDYYFACFKETDYATGGPAEGAPRAALCSAVVDCVRRERCGTFKGVDINEPSGYNLGNVVGCWCKNTDAGDGGALSPCVKEDELEPGPCYNDFLNASEGDAPSDISVASVDVGNALGRAQGLLKLTDAIACPASCWKKSNAMPSGGGSGGGGGAGGSGGTSGGTGGGGKGGSAGSGGMAGSGGSLGGTGGTGGSGPVECSPPSSATCSDDGKRVMDEACVNSPCEADSACGELAEGCLNFDGAQRTLCYDVMECVRSSKCARGATNTLTTCMCGALSTNDCIAAPDTGANAPKGACASIIRQAFSDNGAASNSYILTNFQDDTIAGGAAIHRLNCDKTFLSPECKVSCGF